MTNHRHYFIFRQILGKFRQISKLRNTTASPSVTPGKHAEYFKKVECFCFEQQTINAGEVKDLGIQFIIDNDLPHASGDIILSYTMFDITDSVKETNRL